MRFRAILFSILISLPAVFIVGGGAAYVVANVPGWIRREPARITREYREVAERLLSNPESAAHAGERRKEWRITSRRVNGCPWGCVEADGRACVWVRAEPDLWRSKEVEALRPVPYALIFYWGGSVVALALLALTALAVCSFLRFLRERDDFMVATAHDLTTPLVGMRYAIGRNDADAKSLCERMIRLVDNIKDFLRLGGGRPPPVRESVDLRKACEEAYSLFREDYRDLFDGRDVPVESEPGLPPAAADGTLTVQILWNLFGNDLKYAAPFGPVSVRLYLDGEFVCAEFADGGPGLSSGQMRRAFDRYYRARTARESGKGGFGIGLCTAREFARAMGGDLTVRHNEPKGCVFTLALPRDCTPTS